MLAYDNPDDSTGDNTTHFTYTPNIIDPRQKTTHNMSSNDEPIVLGFNKKEIEIIIMSLQVIKPNPCATNGCTVSSIP